VDPRQREQRIRHSWWNGRNAGLSDAARRRGVFDEIDPRISGRFVIRTMRPPPRNLSCAIAPFFIVMPPSSELVRWRGHGRENQKGMMTR